MAPDSIENPGSRPAQTARDDSERSIGDLLRERRQLNSEQMGRILAYQREHDLKFGEAAIHLGLVNHDDVLYALARQFRYAYADERQNFSTELVVLNQPFSAQAEAIRAVRAQVLLRTQTVPGEPRPRAKKAFAVVSPNGGDGKTFFSANLAVSLAQLGGRTLLVDADLRGPRLESLFGVDGSPGLAGLLAGRTGDSVVRSIPQVANLFVLPVGISPPNPSELLEGPAFGLLLHELLSKFDHVVVDTSASSFGADNVVVAARCGLALVVARKDQVRVDALQGLVGDLAAANVGIVGVVMNEF